MKLIRDSNTRVLVLGRRLNRSDNFDDVRQILVLHLDQLNAVRPARYIDPVKRRYGLDGYHRHTWREVAAATPRADGSNGHIGIDRAAQIVSSCFRRMLTIINHEGSVS